eukprot:s609_g7.t1
MEASSPSIYVGGASNERSNLATYDKVPFPGMIAQKPMSAKDALQSCTVAAWSPMEERINCVNFVRFVFLPSIGKWTAFTRRIFLTETDREMAQAAMLAMCPSA